MLEEWGETVLSFKIQLHKKRASKEDELITDRISPLFTAPFPEEVMEYLRNKKISGNQTTLSMRSNYLWIDVGRWRRPWRNQAQSKTTTFVPSTLVKLLTRQNKSRYPFTAQAGGGDMLDRHKNKGYYGMVKLADAYYHELLGMEDYGMGTNPMRTDMYQSYGWLNAYSYADNTPYFTRAADWYLDATKNKVTKEANYDWVWRPVYSAKSNPHYSPPPGIAMFPGELHQGPAALYQQTISISQLNPPRPITVMLNRIDVGVPQAEDKGSGEFIALNFHPDYIPAMYKAAGVKVAKESEATPGSEGTHEEYPGGYFNDFITVNLKGLGPIDVDWKLARLVEALNNKHGIETMGADQGGFDMYTKFQGGEYTHHPVFYGFISCNKDSMKKLVKLFGGIPGFEVGPDQYSPNLGKTMPLPKLNPPRSKPFPWNKNRVKNSPFKTMKKAQATYDSWKKGNPIGFSANSSLKSMGKIPRASGKYELGEKYERINPPEEHIHWDEYHSHMTDYHVDERQNPAKKACPKPPKKGIIIYGATWCHWCQEAKKYLDEKGKKYKYVDIDEVKGYGKTIYPLTDNYKYIPVVFVDGKFIGGYDALVSRKNPVFVIGEEGGNLDLRIVAPNRDPIMLEALRAATDKSFKHHKWYVKHHLDYVMAIAKAIVKSDEEEDQQLIHDMVWMHDYPKMMGDKDNYELVREFVSKHRDERYTDRLMNQLRWMEEIKSPDWSGRTTTIAAVMSTADALAHYHGPFFQIFMDENPDTPIAELKKKNKEKLERDRRKVRAGPKRKALDSIKFKYKGRKVRVVGNKHIAELVAKKNPMAPGYQSYGWTTQDWRSIKVNSKGDIDYSEKCGAEGTRTKSGKPRLCLAAPIIRSLMKTESGKEVLRQQARKKLRAKKGERVPWHPRIKKLHKKLEERTPEDR